MVPVKVSPKFQVVIPREIREGLGLKPGQELYMYVWEGSIRLVPHRSITELRGMIPGLRWEEGDRDHNDRF